MLLQFPKLNLPNIQRLAQKPNWDPTRYQPMIFNKRVKELSENLKPGSLEYDDFWDEMDYYCYNGFKPKGMPMITGRHFYYLNFNFIDILTPGEKKKRKGSPFYRDLDHWLFLELESAAKYGYGLLITKPRRVGLSEWGSLNCNFESTFYQGNKIGICAGKDDKAQEFYDKLKYSLDNVHEAYRSGRVATNSERLKLGYKDYVNKQHNDYGLRSNVYIKTMYADSGAFEGGSYSMVIFEEAGLFQNLTASFAATKPCFMEGHTQFGVPLVYGTGGEIDKGAKGFKEMWDNHSAYNLKPLFIPAYYYYPGDGVPDKKTGETISFFNRKTGVTDRELAKKYIQISRKRAEKSKDTYTKHVQSYPLIPSEVFLKTKGGKLDTIRLNFQLKKINAGEEPDPILQGRLDWVDTPEIQGLLSRAKNLKEKTKIRVSNNCKVRFIIDEDGFMYKDASPINQNIRHLNYKPDIGACDSYDEEVDENNTKVSAGAIMSYRCFSGPTRKYNKPVGVLVERGDGSFDDDTFYENCVKFAIYWDIEILFEYTKFHIIRYFLDVGAINYIAGRPDIEEAGTQNHGNKYGIKMSGTVKIILDKLLKLEVKENIHKCFFTEIILDLLRFGDENTDIAMTYGIALLHRMDIFDEITEGIEVGYTEQNNEGIIESYYVDTNGNLRINTSGEKNEIKNFNPERDLNERDYNNYVAKINKKEIEIKKEQSVFEKEALMQGIDPSILSLILSERKKNERNN